MANPIVALSPILNGTQFFDNNGNMLSGGYVYTFVGGTNTIPQATYTDASGGTAQSNPIQLSSTGRLPNPIWLIAGAAYNFVITLPDGTTVLTSINSVGASTNGTSGSLVVPNLGVSGTTTTANLIVNSSSILPVLSTPPASVTGSIYFNSIANQWEGYNNVGWTTVGGGGGGATGGGNDQVYVENDSVATQPYTIGIGAYQAGTTVTGNIFTLNTHNYVADSRIHFAGNIPSGITTDTVYYVIAGNLTTNTFTISNIGGGSQLTGITNSGTNSFSTGKIRNAEVSGPYYVATGANVTIPTGSSLSVI